MDIKQNRETLTFTLVSAGQSPFTAQREGVWGTRHQRGLRPGPALVPSSVLEKIVLKFQRYVILDAERQ